MQGGDQYILRKPKRNHLEQVEKRSKQRRVVPYGYPCIGAVEVASASVANTYVVIMPPSEQYMSESEWKILEDKSGYFTLQKGDLLALGEVDAEITGVTPNRESEVKTALSPNVMTIKSIEDNTRVAHGKHYRLEGF